MDFLVITETWLRPDGQDQFSINSLTPNGFRLQHTPRIDKRGGGLAIVYHSSLQVDSLRVGHFESFESFTADIKHLSTTLCLTALYRPPHSSQPKFISEFADLLELQSVGNINSIILGDFNLPMNNPSQPSVANFKSTLDSLNFQQLVSHPTHTNGNTLDLIICPATAAVSVKIKGVNWSVSSDHGAILCDIQLPKPVRPRKNISVRKWSSVDITTFNEEISSYDMSSHDSADPTTLYSDMLSKLRDKHAPSRSITITHRPATPWYTQAVRHAKTLCRKYERQWRKTLLTIHFELYKSQKLQLKSLRDKAKADYIKCKLQESTSSKDTFAVLNTLLQKNTEHPLPPHDDITSLTESFASYFNDKIATVRRSFNTDLSCTPACNKPNISRLHYFNQVPNEEIQKLVSKSATKSCALDPIPTWILKKCPSLIPHLGNIVNYSLSNGQVPQSLKRAHVVPVLKKPSLNPDEFKNYRPVSNLAFSSKIIERAVSSQLKMQCSRNGINMYFQSAYKVNHSTETALMRVQNDLLKAVDSQGGAVLVLLDLSAAFDTIDHQVLLRTLQEQIGIDGSALSWFRSYLTDRQQSVKIGDSLSTNRPLPYGVPQGSVLGPQLFSIYTLPLQNIIDANKMSYHLYADDTQIYITFNPKCAESTESMKSTIDICTTNIGHWMRSNFLKLNSDKTEVLVLSKPSINITVPSLTIDGLSILVNNSVRNLGVHYDHLLKMDVHVRTMCKKAFYQIHLIHKVRKFIDEDTARTLVRSNVTPLLDYCNGLLVGLPDSLLNLLQRVQNSAARVVKQLPKSCHITPVLKALHWLPIRYRIEYKTILLAFKSLNGLAPDYLKDLLTKYQPGRTLRSTNKNLLVVPRYNSSSVGGRAFEIIAPTLWNNLPPKMRHIKSINTFKRSLKTHLFKAAFK